MSLIRFGSPFEEIRRLEKDISNIFRDYPRVDEGKTYSLPMNIEENSEEYLIIANVPGFNQEQINIEATSQYVDIEAKKEEVKEEKEKNYVMKEISRSNYRRRLSFDKPVDTTKAATTLKDGVLTIKMPKMEQAKSVKLIPEAT